MKRESVFNEILYRCWLNSLYPYVARSIAPLFAVARSQPPVLTGIDAAIDAYRNLPMYARDYERHCAICAKLGIEPVPREKVREAWRPVVMALMEATIPYETEKKLPPLSG